MSTYQHKTDNVEAVRLDAATGSLTVGDVTAAAGQWLVKHADGTLTAVDDAEFTADYEAQTAAATAPAEHPDVVVASAYDAPVVDVGQPGAV